jgi:hypothetical protein
MAFESAPGDKAGPDAGVAAKKAAEWAPQRERRDHAGTKRKMIDDELLSTAERAAEKQQAIA